MTSWLDARCLAQCFTNNTWNNGHRIAYINMSSNTLLLPRMWPPLDMWVPGPRMWPPLDMWVPGPRMWPPLFYCFNICHWNSEGTCCVGTWTRELSWVGVRRCICNVWSSFGCWQLLKKDSLYKTLFHCGVHRLQLVCSDPAKVTNYPNSYKDTLPYTRLRIRD